MDLDEGRHRLAADAVIVLCCPFCKDWTVQTTSVLETWHRLDGPAREFATGRCARCTSVVLVEPSPLAVEDTAERYRKSKAAMKTVAGDD